MPKLIHVSDTHITPIGQQVVGHDASVRFAQVIDAINSHHSDADLCVITGDLTDKGDKEAYEEFARVLKDLTIPYRLLLGNHDNRAAFRAVFPDEPTDQNGFVQSFKDINNYRLIFLDTLDEDGAGAGRVCPRRNNWLALILSEAEDKDVVLFMHHPPFSVGVPIFEPYLLKNSAEFLPTIKAHQSAKHIAFGHLHLTTSGFSHGVAFSCNRGVCHRIALQFTQGVTEFIRSEPSFDVILLSDQGVVVHHTAPFTQEDMVAREYPTSDGIGRLELIRTDAGTGDM